MAYFGPFQAVYDLPISNVAVTSGNTTTSAWMPASTLVGANFWFYQASSGSPSSTITIDYTIFPLTTANAAPTIPVSGGTNYRTVTLKSAETTKAAWQHYDTPAELEYPFLFYRINVAVSSANATVYVGVCRNGI